MRRRFLPLVLALLLAAAACQGGAEGRSTGASTTPVTAAAAAAGDPLTPVPPTTAPPALPPAAPSAEPDGEAALRHVQVLAGEIGPRPAGSPAEQRAAAYIAGRLREYGYEVELQAFPVKLFASRSVEFRVLAPQEEQLRVAPLTNSAPGAVTGDLFDASLGYPGDYPAEGIAGRVALVRRGKITFGDKVRTAAAAGAAAVVLYEPGRDVVPGTITGQVPAIPTLTIPGDDGARLRDSMANGPVRVALAFDGGVEEGTATNVIGRPPGGGCTAVVGGHYDSVAVAPGGSDNASGTATVIELARVQAARGNPQRACFIAFSGEELGLLGSQYFLSQLPPADRQAIRFMINFDMVAVGDEWLFIGTPALQRRAQEIAAAAGITGRRADLLGASSDHAAFIDRKVPALMLHRSNDNLLHTPQDTADRISAEPLGIAVRLGLAWLDAFAQD